MTGLLFDVTPGALFAIESKNADQCHWPSVVELFAYTALFAVDILASQISSSGDPLIALTSLGLQSSSSMSAGSTALGTDRS